MFGKKSLEELLPPEWEGPAFVEQPNTDYSSEEFLGKVLFDVLVYKNKSSRAKFFYIDPALRNGTYEGFSHICVGELNPGASVLSKFPLYIKSSFYQSKLLELGSKELEEAIKLLRSYGLYPWEK